MFKNLLYPIYFYMKVPSWSEFDEKTSNLEKEIDRHVRTFKNNHPLLDRALKQSFTFLPSPFSTVAQNIYNTVAGSEEDRSSQVLNYFKCVKNKGENYYYSELQGLHTNWIQYYILFISNEADMRLSRGDYGDAVALYDILLQLNPSSAAIVLITKASHVTIWVRSITLLLATKKL
jgi:hypothetical protein